MNSPSTISESPIQHLKSLDYRWGDCQAIRYSPANEDLFQQPYLSQLYYRCKHSGRARNGILEPLFCGATDLSHDGIVGYLMTRPLIVLGEWKHTGGVGRYESAYDSEVHTFEPLGFCFPVSFLPYPPPPPPRLAAAFGAYAFFQSAWRTPQQTVLSCLGLAYLFAEFNLAAVHGQRYVSNHLTARWLRQFGFHDIATVPNLLWNSQTQELESCVVSTLERSVFEGVLGGILSKV